MCVSFSLSKLSLGEKKSNATRQEKVVGTRLCGQASRPPTGLWACEWEAVGFPPAQADPPPTPEAGQRGVFGGSGRVDAPCFPQPPPSRIPRPHPSAPDSARLRNKTAIVSSRAAQKNNRFFHFGAFIAVDAPRASPPLQKAVVFCSFREKIF